MVCGVPVRCFIVAQWRLLSHIPGSLHRSDPPISRMTCTFASTYHRKMPNNEVESTMRHNRCLRTTTKVFLIILNIFFACTFCLAVTPHRKRASTQSPRMAHERWMEQTKRSVRRCCDAWMPMITSWWALATHNISIYIREYHLFCASIRVWCVNRVKI